jgi:transcription termination/antitermination protein NusA
MSINTSELKEMINFVCAEKGLDPEEIIKAIERAIASSYRKEFGNQLKSYSCTFNLDTGKYIVYDDVKIVDEVIVPEKEKSVEEARLYDPSVQVGDIISTQVAIEDSVDFGRIASQIGRQVLMQSINASKHTKVLQEYKDKVGELVNVEIDYSRKGGYLVKLGQTMAFINKEALCPTDRFKAGQYVKAVILDIKDDEQGNAKIVLSRSAPEFVLAVLKQEIPEIENGVVNIEKIVREAGARTKILVSSDDETVDPVGTVIGRKNTRLVNVQRELGSTMQEKIDVIEYIPDDVELMIMDALEPAEIDRVELDEDGLLATVYCSSEQAFLAVGKRGVNVRLASKLLDYMINIVTEESPTRIIA